MNLLLSTSGNPFTNDCSANATTVLTASFADHTIMSYPARNMELGDPLVSAIDHFKRFTRNEHNIPDLAILGSTSSNCGGFSIPVLTAIREGKIYTCIGAPTTMSMESSMSVYSFLRMQPGVKNPPRLPCDGWTDVKSP